MAQAHGPLTLGQQLAGRYEIVRPLGSGGMGWVYEAQDLRLAERVALKVLKEGGRGTEAHGRFVKEVKLARRVRHKNVAAIHDYGEDGDIQFITMALVAGQDLRQLIHEKAGLPWDEGYRIALQIGAGLEAAHEEGVIHRDLKPANVMVEASGHVRVMDFGVAKARDDGEPGVTGSGVAIGTPEYMSPEQVQAADIDLRSDVYAFAVVIYEIFTGVVPFRGENRVGTMVMQLYEPPPLDPPNSRLPGTLVSVLRRALAKHRDERFASCREMMEAIEAARLSVLTDSEPHPAELPDSGESPTIALSRQDSLRTPAAVPSEARLLLPMLALALRSAQVEVRIGAARALALHGKAAATAVPEVVAALQELLADSEANAVAMEALRAIAPEAEAPAMGVPADDLVARTPGLSPADPVRAGPPATPPLSAAPTAPEPEPPPPPAPVPAPRPAPRPPPLGKPSARLPDKVSRPVRAGLPLHWLVVGVVLAMLAALGYWLSRPTPPSSLPLPPSTVRIPTPGPPPLPSPEPALPPVTATTTTTLAPRAPAGTTPSAPRPIPAAAPPVITTTTLPEPTTTTTTLEPTTTTTSTTTSTTTTTTLPPLRMARCLVPKPDYPLIAMQRRREGTVLVRITVDESGRVAEATVVRPVELLNDAALKAARAARCTAATRGDQPVREWVEVPVQFQLPK